MEKVLRLKQVLMRRQTMVLPVLLFVFSLGLISSVSFYEQELLAQYEHINRSFGGLPDFARKSETAGAQTENVSEASAPVSSSTGSTARQKTQATTTQTSQSTTTTPPGDSPGNGRREDPGKPDDPGLPLVCGLVGVGC